MIKHTYTTMSKTSASDQSTKTQQTIPVYNTNTPGGGMQQPVVMSANTPIYSSYTGELVGHGSILKGTLGDAPVGHPNHGKNFHVIQHVQANNTFMVHGRAQY